MRPHGFFMHPPHDNAESISRRFAKRAGLVNGMGIEINMGVIASNAGNRGAVFCHGVLFSREGALSQRSRTSVPPGSLARDWHEMM